MHNFWEIIKTIGIYSNIIMLVGFSFEKILLKNEKNTALVSNLSVFLAVVLCFYLISILVLLTKALILKNCPQSLLWAIFLVSPFVIGSVSTYKKAGVYINLQVSVLFICLLCFLFL